MIVTEETNFNTRMAETLATASGSTGGGYHSLSYKRLFRIIRKFSSGITPLLWPANAMNKLNMTGQTCHDTLLILPFNICTNLGCNGAVIPALCKKII